jgi:hypothetical protein
MTPLASCQRPLAPLEARGLRFSAATMCSAVRASGGPCCPSSFCPSSGYIGWTLEGTLLSLVVPLVLVEKGLDHLPPRSELRGDVLLARWP